mmetsp:Transcript_28519/g.47199  ORF Transcript_28519/g.47199 Transcript_28519/m.47199 type:complete len:215 (-) Transcript_28519:190-834(-)
MPTHTLKINTNMVCGGCSGTVEKALWTVPGVTTVSVSLDSQTAKIETKSDEIACLCAKKGDGTCSCGIGNCKCMEKALLTAVTAVGFDAIVATSSDVHKCGSNSNSKGKGSGGHCGAVNCTCGADCQCGDNCQCAGCPASSTTSASSCCGNNSKGGPCGKRNCTCGPNCQCGDSCQCANCNSNSSLWTMQNISIGVALFAVGWVASSRFGGRGR